MPIALVCICFVKWINGSFLPWEDYIIRLLAQYLYLRACDSLIARS